MNHSSLDVPYRGRKYTPETLAELSGDWPTLAPIRIAQHLANVWHLIEPSAFTKDSPTTHRLNGVNVFGPNYLNHPWTIWASKNSDHYAWLLFYGQDIAVEYERRMGLQSRGHRHGMVAMLKCLEDMPESLPEGEWEEPIFAFGVE